MAATTKKAVKTVNFRAELNKKLNGLYLKALKTKTGTKAHAAIISEIDALEKLKTKFSKK
jgi:hypothetical protein